MAVTTQTRGQRGGEPVPSAWSSTAGTAALWSPHDPEAAGWSCSLPCHGAPQPPSCTRQEPLDGNAVTAAASPLDWPRGRWHHQGGCSWGYFTQ